MLPRSFLVGLFTGASLVATAAFAASPVESFVPASASDQAISPLPPGHPAASDALRAAAQCNESKPRMSIVELHWQPSSIDGLLMHQVDISKFRDGFAKGRFKTTRELASATKTVAVDGPEPGLNYYWRVRTKTSAGWAASRVGRFEVPICPHDGLEELPFGGGNDGVAQQGDKARDEVSS